MGYADRDRLRVVRETGADPAIFGTHRIVDRLEQILDTAADLDLIGTAVLGNGRRSFFAA